MMDWNREYHDISVKYEDKIVRIKSDDFLREYLEQLHGGALLLAEHILKTYEGLFCKPLKINHHSLAIEIIAHVFVDNILENMSEFSNFISHDKLKPVVNALEAFRKHTKVIDCGEASVDNNRHVWDVMEPIHGFIYGLANLSTDNENHKVEEKDTENEINKEEENHTENKISKEEENHTENEINKEEESHTENEINKEEENHTKND